MDTRLDGLLCDLLTADDWELGRLVGHYECRSDAMTIGSMTLYDMWSKVMVEEARAKGRQRASDRVTGQPENDHSE